MVRFISLLLLNILKEDVFMSFTRRYFLQSSGAFALSSWLSPLQLLAEEETLVPVKRGKTLVVLFLRGGMDGLNFIVPFKDPSYYRLRPSIAISPPGTKAIQGQFGAGAIDLNGFFGLHPRSKELAPIFHTGNAVAIQAVGYRENTRSHFEEQDVWETAMTSNVSTSSGWLNRHLSTSEGYGPIRALSIGDVLPRILRGKAQAYAVQSINDLKFAEEEETLKALEEIYQMEAQSALHSAPNLLHQAGLGTLEGIKQLRSVLNQSYHPLVTYPKTALALKLQQVARLIKANVGLEVVELDYGGWDTHQGQGAAVGSFGNLAQELSEAIAAFYQDLAEKMEDVLLLTLSEFGRTASENGTGGTDHGSGNCLLAIGGNVAKLGQNQPRYTVGKWPGLAQEQLFESRDLDFLIDFRDVFAEVVSKHLGNPQLDAIFPKHTYSPIGLL